MSHTPGPWFVFPHGEERMWHVGPAQHSVVFVREVDDAEANARLIAAAPDLLEACEMLREVADGSWSRNLLDAAIKKARGEA